MENNENQKSDNIPISKVSKLVKEELEKGDNTPRKLETVRRDYYREDFRSEGIHKHIKKNNNYKKTESVKHYDRTDFDPFTTEKVQKDAADYANGYIAGQKAFVNGGSSTASSGSVAYKRGYKAGYQHAKKIYEQQQASVNANSYVKNEDPLTCNFLEGEEALISLSERSGNSEENDKIFEAIQMLGLNPTKKKVTNIETTTKEQSKGRK